MTSPSTRRVIRRIVRWTAAAACLAIGLAVAGVAWVQIAGRSYDVPLDDAPASPVAIVFGAGLTPSGKPSSYLAARLDVARDLYADGVVLAILVSGDNSTTSHDEPTAMRDYLVDHGVPVEDIALDYAGFDTYDTCTRAKRVFGVDEAIVTTQAYHLPRAAFSCAQAGIEVHGVAAERVGGDIAVYALREVLASAKAALDAITGRDPVHLGPAESSVTDILTRRQDS